jgi:hypothetical protein
VRHAWAKSLDRIGLLLPTTAVVAHQYGVPSEEFWSDLLSDRGYLLVALIAMIGIFGVLTPFEWLSNHRQMERRAGVRQQILFRFGRMLSLAQNVNPPLDQGDLGLHIWRVGRSLRHPIKRRLYRLASYRLGSTPATRSFNPPKGTGVVGLSWKHNTEESIDVKKLATELTDSSKFRAHRSKYGPDAVMGMTWEEFRRVRHRGAVFASPIRNGQGAFIGCVSVDASHGFNELDTTALWQEVNELCAIIGNDGFQYV